MPFPGLTSRYLLAYERCSGYRSIRAVRYRSQEDRQMGTIASLDPVRPAPAASWGMRSIGSALSGDAGQADSDFLVTLLAMAGHDLRQPLQVITNAHDVLVQALASEEQQEQLIRAENATAQLAS